MTKGDVFIAKSADVIGKVKLGKGSNIWFQAVLRGDYNTIEIGVGSNIQDGSVVHVDVESPVVIGKDVTVGHNCIIHGCQIGNNVLIGMGSTIMNDAVIGENTIIGANSLVTEGKELPANSLIMGCPAKFIRHLTTEEVSDITRNAQAYVKNSQDFESRVVSENAADYVLVD